MRMMNKDYVYYIMKGDLIYVHLSLVTSYIYLLLDRLTYDFFSNLTSWYGSRVRSWLAQGRAETAVIVCQDVTVCDIHYWFSELLFDRHLFEQTLT